MEPFVGQICLFGFNYAPQDWVPCDGRLLQVAQYQALFALLGTIYGGDGRTTFGVPDLRGRMAISQGQGPGLSQRVIGQMSGAETSLLTIQNMPAHNHAFAGTATSAPVSLNVTGLTAATTVTVATGPTPTSPTVSGNLLADSAADPLYAAPSSTPKGALGGVSATTTLTGGTASGNVGLTPAGTIGATGNSTPFSNMPPYLVLNYCIAYNGVFPPRP